MQLNPLVVALVVVRTRVIEVVNRIFTNNVLIVLGALSFIFAYQWEWISALGIKHTFYYFIAIGMAAYSGYFKRMYKEGAIGVFTEVVFYLFLFNIVDEIRRECMKFYWNQYIIGLGIILCTIYRNRLKITQWKTIPPNKDHFTGR